MRRNESDGNGSRTRSDLIDNQASFPEELATENVHHQSTGDWNRTNGLLVQSEVQRPATATPAFLFSKALRPGIEPDLRASKAHVATTRRREFSTANQRVSCGSRTRLSELEAQHLCRSAKDTIDAEV